VLPRVRSDVASYKWCRQSVQRRFAPRLRPAAPARTTIANVVDRALLTDVELFRGLGPDDLEALVDAAEDRLFGRNDVLFSEGDDPTELFVVTSGRIAIANKSVDGRESVMALMERGDLFGEMPLFDGLNRSAEARALETSGVIAIPYAPLRALYESQPELLWNVVALLAGRLRSTDEALADSVFLDVTGRTAKRLLEMADGEDDFVLPVTQEELAGMVGASRERVNKAIASFVRLGWIEQADRRYRILQRDELTRRAR
jgi:CRP/FNR family transcriptional regulator, cyclic AMP receptor protein